MSIQQTIIKGIREQLYCNSYLVLPDFGGFVLKTRPSHFTGSGGSIVPPSKTISFNAQLKQNDGVLVLWLQKELNCDAAEALRHLKEFSAFCSGILTNRRRISLESIGFFYLDFENNISFEAQSDNNFMTDSFGLAPVSLRPLPVEQKEIKRENVFTDRVVKQTAAEPAKPVEKKKRSLSPYLTPALLAVFLVMFLTVLLSNRKITGQLKSAFVGSNSQGTYQPHVYAPLILDNVASVNPVYVTDANGVALVHLNKNTSLPVSVLPSGDLNSGSFQYEVVLGCFSLKHNADKLVRKLSKDNVKAFVSGKNERGLFVVSNGSFEQRDQAVAKLSKLRSRYPNAWIRNR